MIITKTLGIFKQSDFISHDIQKVFLTYSDMLKKRQRLTTDKGFEFAIDLSHHQEIKDQTVLFCDDKTVIYIEEKEVEAFVIEPKTKLEWAICAYNIGNMHKMAYLSENEILVPYDKTLEGMFHKLSIPFAVKMCKMSGIPANGHGAVGHHHHHE